MRFNNNDEDDNEKSDWFDGPDIDIEEKHEERHPRHKPDEPEYYDEDESQWSHLQPSRKYRFWIYLTLAAVAVAIVAAVYMRFFSPYIVDGVQCGYVESIQQRGDLIKTYEGVLIPYSELMDTTRVYRRDFTFTAASKSIYDKLRDKQVVARPVRVHYKMYHATVPWRGESRIIVTAVDSVDPSRILPPEFTPEYYRSRRDLTDTLDNNARHRNLLEANDN